MYIIFLLFHILLMIIRLLVLAIIEQPPVWCVPITSSSRSHHLLSISFSPVVQLCAQRQLQQHHSIY